MKKIEIELKQEVYETLMDMKELFDTNNVNEIIEQLIMERETLIKEIQENQPDNIDWDEQSDNY